jgi:hypothetical protein
MYLRTQKRSEAKLNVEIAVAGDEGSLHDHNNTDEEKHGDQIRTSGGKENKGGDGQPYVLVK